MKHLLLIDASSFAYRAHFAPSPDIRTQDGEPVKAAIGFAAMVWRMMGRAGEGDPPTYAAAAFDHPSKTFRHKLFPAYKGVRKRPEDLKAQLPAMREAADVLGLKPIDHAGFEADDVLATLATRAMVKNIRTTIVSIDKDLCQLIRDGWIEMVDPFNRTRTTSAEVVKKFGVEPHVFVDLQALWGDAVDGIPGVEGFGIKKAAGLIRRFGSLDAVIKALDEPDALPPSVRECLKRERKALPLYRKLATLRQDVPLTVEIEGLVPASPTRSLLRTFLAGLDCAHLLDRVFPEIRSGGRVMFRVVDPIDPKTAGDWYSKELITPGQTVPAVPQCGFYKRRLGRECPWVPVRIWRTPDVDLETGYRSGKDRLFCEVNGERADPETQWGYVCTHPITKDEFTKMGKVKDARKAIKWGDIPVSQLRKASNQ